MPADDDTIQAYADALVAAYLADPAEDEGTIDDDDREMEERRRWDRILDRAMVAEEDIEDEERFDEATGPTH